MSKKISDIKKRMEDIKFFIFDKVNYISPIEEAGIVIYVNGIVMNIVISILVLIITASGMINIGLKRMIILPFIWLTLSVLAMIVIDKYVKSRNYKNINYLFFTTALTLLSAAGFLIPGILMTIGNYFIYEAYYRNNSK